MSQKDEHTTVSDNNCSSQIKQMCAHSAIDEITTSTKLDKESGGVLSDVDGTDAPHNRNHLYSYDKNNNGRYVESQTANFLGPVMV